MIKFRLPVRTGEITGRFSDPAKSGRAGIHGGLDIIAIADYPGSMAADIVSPEDGRARAFASFRFGDGDQQWPSADAPRTVVIDGNGKPFPFRDCFHDMYGFCIIVRSLDRERTHLLAHAFGNSTVNEGPFNGTWGWVEQAAKTRWPVHTIYSEEIMVGKGMKLGRVGDAGYSTGAHVHWEVHHGYQREWYDDRIDPEPYLEGR